LTTQFNPEDGGGTASETLDSNHHTTWLNSPKSHDLYILGVFEDRVPKRIFGAKREKIMGGCRRLQNEELHQVMFR
jgi:hypothetical protein